MKLSTFCSISKTSLVILLCMASHFVQAQNGLLAAYYDGKDFDKFVSESYVKNIEAYWNETPPVSGIDPHNCSIRWTGKLKPGKTATYLFSALVDDGIRVWIDGDIIIDQWNLNDVGLFSGKKLLRANEEYDLKVEYFNALREGEIRLQWAIEKAKEDQSWYETFFGVDYEYEVITAEYFIRPDQKLPTAIKEEVKPTPIAAQKPAKKKTAPTPKEKTVEPSPIVTTYKVTTEVEAKKYIPKNVEFVRTKTDILPSSYHDLDTFAKFMNDNPQVTVTIEGHTNVAGDKGSNQFLSERRANKVARYLVQKGITGRRIKTVGYGGSRPLKVPPKGEYYAPNRRVVFIIHGLE